MKRARGKTHFASKDHNYPTITVCSHCSRASCWQGLLYCEDAKTAGTAECTVAFLRKLDLEDESYWTPEADAAGPGLGRFSVQDLIEGARDV